MNLMQRSRRDFLEFMGRASLVAGLGLNASACQQKSSRMKAQSTKLKSFSSRSTDQFETADGLSWKLLLKQGDLIHSSGLRFGMNNDFLAFLPLTSEEALLWVNHEYPEPLYRIYPQGKKNPSVIPDAKFFEEQTQGVGGSVIKIRRDPKSSTWTFVFNDAFNRRLDGDSKIPIIADRDIQGSRFAIGTLGNCGGGVTPWGNILTCEENYQDYYGEAVFDEKGNRSLKVKSGGYHWEARRSAPPEHYGWVVEVNPQTGEAKKLTSLGRFAHEGACVVQSSTKQLVVYMGDDDENQCLYKFVSHNQGSLEAGVLYVANFQKGKWMPLEWKSQPKLKEKFKDQTDVLIRTREAARILGGTPLDRPEDIERDPVTGGIIVALTNNADKGNFYGSLLRVDEFGNDPLSLEFRASTFKAGGSESGFACPDNLAFDREGNLWITTDISGSQANQGPYQNFGNNGLFVIPSQGPQAGQVIQVASAPFDAELTGPCFSNDGRTLFLSVQHPGEFGFPDKVTSRWPEGGTSQARSAVVALQGPLLDHFTKA